MPPTTRELAAGPCIEALLRVTTSPASPTAARQAAYDRVIDLCGPSLSS